MHFTNCNIDSIILINKLPLFDVNSIDKTISTLRKLLIVTIIAKNKNRLIIIPLRSSFFVRFFFQWSVTITNQNVSITNLLADERQWEELTHATGWWIQTSQALHRERCASISTHYSAWYSQCERARQQTPPLWCRHNEPIISLRTRLRHCHTNWNIYYDYLYVSHGTSENQE